jgi:outer membrane protein OmpA-like peptidoglycan-associated protein
LAPRSVGAQATPPNEGFALNRFDIAEVGSDWFAGDSLDFRGGFRPGIRLGADWAHKPLVRYDEDGNELDVVISDQVHGYAGLAVVLGERVRLGVTLPVLLTQGSQETMVNGSVFGATQATTLGDLRGSLDLRIVGEYGDAISLVIGGQVHLPTGDRAAFTGDGSVRVVPRLMIAGDLAAFAYSLRVGYAYRPENEGFGLAPTGSEIGFVATAGVRFADGVLLLGPELWGSTVVSSAESAFVNESTPLELVFGLHVRAGGFSFGAGAGPGLNRGMGAPAVRVLGTIGYLPDASDRDGDDILDGDDACPDIPGPPNKEKRLHGCPDRDGDGIIDPEDACPDTPGVRNPDPTKNGCPPKHDRDRDGILDEVDACPDVPGVADPDPAKNGCPPDRDGDGIIDDEDACPDEPGVRDPDPQKNGCPPKLDRDGDQILDEDDACPDIPGPPNEDPTLHGCPLARIEKDQIKISQRIEFEFDKAKLVPSSEPVLKAVLEILDLHPEIVDVLVEGHTDNVGKAKYNKKLSDKRAAAVVKWLVENGIGRDRLRSAGIGMARPIESNDDEVGRQKNRRVEFHIKQDESLEKESESGTGEAVDPTAEGEPAKTEEPAAEPEPKSKGKAKKSTKAKKPGKAKKQEALETDDNSLDDPANW